MSETLLPCAEALEFVLTKARAAVPEEGGTLTLSEALGRVTSRDLVADRDQPPFHRSTRDGFAVRATDLEGGGAVRVMGTLRAGGVWHGEPLRTGEAIEIMTGAPLPPGADAVVMVEHVYRDGKALHLPGARTLRAGENVVPQGAEARAGDLVVPSGTRLQAAEIALAASLGYAEVPVFAQPRVAILSTGDELVELGEQPATHQIRNSNSHGLAALVRSNGGAPHRAKPVADDISALEKAIAQERDAPLLVLSGGVSAGRYDFVEHALAAHGAEFFFTGVKMQPGKPVVFARLPATETHNVQWVFGLPGNPVSTQVTFLLFVAPLLRALGGEKDPTPHFVEARLARAVPGKPGLTRFLPARLSSSLDGAQAEVLGWQGSGDLAANARANCYAVLPAIGEDMPAGTSVAVLLR